MTLTQMSFTADMSTTDNLLKIQELLPIHLQSKWATTAHTLMETQVMPNFSHMTDFVEEQARVASNVYGMHVGRAQKMVKPNVTTRRPKDTKASSFATHGSREEANSKTPSSGCHLCDKDHNLEECEDFKKKTVAERFTFAKRKGLCFNCLRRSHTAMECRLEPKCPKDGCKRKHHTLLHSERRRTERDEQQSGAGQDGTVQQDRTGQEGAVYSNQHKTTREHHKVCLRAPSCES